MNTVVQTKSRAARGFSLIEIIGVLAVIMIMAAAIAPALLKQLDKAAQDTEGAALQQIANGLQSYVQDHRRIPGPATFFQDIGGELGWLASDVSTNARRNPRYYLVDPALRLGTNTALPYVQTMAGSPNPTNARVMVVTSLGGPLPTAISTPSLTATDFANLWNSTDGSTPAGWTYGGSFADIKIQRINLTPLFVWLTLNSNPQPGGRYTVDSTDGSDNVALPANPFTAAFLRGSVLWLHDLNGNLQTKQVLDIDSSFFYESGVWRGKFFMATDSQRRGGADLQAAYEIFMAAPPNPNAKFGVTQAMVTGDMINYMSNYIFWATNGFDSGKKGGLDNAQTAMGNDTKNYVYKAGK